MTNIISSLGRDMFCSHEINGVIVVIKPLNKRGQYHFEAELGVFHKGYQERTDKKQLKVLSKVDFVKFLINIGYGKGEIVAAFRLLENEGSIRGMGK